MGFQRHDTGTLAFQVRTVWLNMRAAIGEELKAFGLSTPQYATLIMTQAHPGMSVADIARQVASTRQAANEMLAGLEAQGLVERRPNPSDRRSHKIHITESGRTRLAEARVAVARREADLEAAFTPEQRTAARDWLDGVARACRLSTPPTDSSKG
ncbi:MarR family winged helix-turn-helix transcriptional regulator [Actinomadura litoris]|uniref:MarR family winged helix-turn-helix transcriptional regulator n=1 Tax=Actinomadura litoris TaxID=2678616 RepID=UPI001FA745D9|nr:MarR family transcriptional regulator [Actinomadura litoris]